MIANHMVVKRTAGFAIIAAALALLTACVMTPGKFISTLDIRADRSFTFTYKGEVIITDFSDLSKNFGKDDDDIGTSDGESDDAEDGDEGTTTDAEYRQIALSDTDAPSNAKTQDNAGADSSGEEEDQQAKMQAIADALAKEEGYRSVQYAGDGKFIIDYQISGKLDHSFLFPFNPDAQAIIPFMAIEVRKDGKVRVQAPGFAESKGSSPATSGLGKENKATQRQGTFTLTTNAEIVSQNQEDGAKSTPQGKQIIWKITPYTTVAPMAVLQLAAK